MCSANSPIFQSSGDGLGYKGRAEGNCATEALGERHDVGDYVVVLCGKPFFRCDQGQ